MAYRDRLDIPPGKKFGKLFLTKAMGLEGVAPRGTSGLPRNRKRKVLAMRRGVQ